MKIQIENQVIQFERESAQLIRVDAPLINGASWHITKTCGAPSISAHVAHVDENRNDVCIHIWGPDSHEDQERLRELWLGPEENVVELVISELEEMDSICENCGSALSPAWTGHEESPSLFVCVECKQ